MNEQSRNGGRGYSRAAPNSERALTFMGSDGSSATDRPVVFAKVSMGQKPKPTLKQGAPVAAPVPVMNVPAGHAPLSIKEASDLRDAMVASRAGAEFIFKTKGCPGVTQESFAKLDSLKSRLDSFLKGAKEGNTFPASAEDLDLMTKVIACAIQAQRTPDKWAYIILGGAVAGTIMAMSL